VTARYGPQEVARLLGLPEPTAEQAAVISAPTQPMAVIAGAGSGKSETMAARLVWLVANGLVRPQGLGRAGRTGPVPAGPATSFRPRHPGL
jgi:ATP-dependent DNA helicase UvrD/PcrA